jgi:CRP-like cAMP-binding protein
MAFTSDAPDKGAGFDIQAFMARHGSGTISHYADRQVVYAQGDPSDALFYVVSGQVKVTILSEFGKEAVIAILGPGDFFGEGCVEGQLPRRSTITAAGATEVARVERAVVIRALEEDPAFIRSFTHFLLDRNHKLQSNLVDQLFNSSEKRLARILLTLANSGTGPNSSLITIPVNQEMLASMVGTTRSRINQFMNKFRKMGFIEYNGHIKVNESLMNVILQDQVSDEESGTAK